MTTETAGLAQNGTANGSPPKPAAGKLHGRAFYESIGSPKMVVAPMVDRSEFAWRKLTRSFMNPSSSSSSSSSSESERPILTYSPMFHARLFGENAAYRQAHFEAMRQSQSGNGEGKKKKEEEEGDATVPHLDGNPTHDRPLIVQFCANDPDDLLAAARHVESYCDAVDLNLGCPQGIARRGHYGAFLQEDPDLIYRLINKLHTHLSIPVTAKFRIRDTKEETLAYARMILDAGASFIAVHGRTREQKGHNTGVADWEYIRFLRDNLPSDTVIFANGNILAHEDLERCLAHTGADGVMTAEGNLSNPAIFADPPRPDASFDAREYWRGGDGRGGWRMDFVVRRYMDIIYEFVLETEKPSRKPVFLPGDAVEEENEHGDKGTGKEEEAEPEEEGPPAKKRKRSKAERRKPTSPNLTAMQGHLFQLLRPLISRKTHVRDALARSRGGDMAAFEHVVHLVDQVVREGVQEYEAHPDRFDTPNDPQSSTDGGGGGGGGADEPSLTGSKATIAEYGRPWWVCQPHIRPLPEEALQTGALQPKKNQMKKGDAPSGVTEKMEKTPAAAQVNGVTATVGIEEERMRNEARTEQLVNG